MAKRQSAQARARAARVARTDKRPGTRTERAQAEPDVEEQAPKQEPDADGYAGADTPAAVRGRDVERPISLDKQNKTVADERAESNQNMRVDGTTPRHTEPLGIPAPGQGGRPGPERRVRPQGGMDEALPEPTEEEAAAREKELGPKMLVEATRMGYTENVRRRVGDVFHIRKAQFSKRWMRPVEGVAPTPTKSNKQALKEFHDEELARRMGQPVTERKAAAQSTGDSDVLS